MGPEAALEFGKAGQQMTLTIENSPKPVIAAVNGFALGGGCEISLACHIRVASETATFGQPEVLLGILPGWGGTQRLPRLVGSGLANEIITTGRMVSALEAKSMGLVNHVVPPDELMNKCMEIANQILKNGPNAIAQSLSCIQKRMGMSMEDGLQIEVDAPIADSKSKLKAVNTKAVNTKIERYIKEKPKVLRTTSSLINLFPILIGIIALACNILRVSVAAYLINRIILAIFIPPLVDPPIPPKNIIIKSKC